MNQHRLIASYLTRDSPCSCNLVWPAKYVKFVQSVASLMSTSGRLFRSQGLRRTYTVCLFAPVSAAPLMAEQDGTDVVVDNVKRDVEM